MLNERGGLQVDLLYDPDDPDYDFDGRPWNVELILRDDDDRYPGVLQDEILTPVAERFGGEWNGS